MELIDFTDEMTNIVNGFQNISEKVGVSCSEYVQALCKSWAEQEARHMDDFDARWYTLWDSPIGLDKLGLCDEKTHSEALQKEPEFKESEELESFMEDYLEVIE